MNPVAPVTATLIVRQPQLGFGERRLNTMRHGTPTGSRQTPTPNAATVYGPTTVGGNECQRGTNRFVASAADRH